MDWSEKDLCIKCNEGGKLLVCSENGCPLAVHEGCMGCPARFDDAGHFYCPYCLYKQAVGEARQAREYALARKNALLLFMDEKTIGTGQHIEENKRTEDNGRNESKVSQANVTNDGKSKSNDAIQLDEEQNIGNAEENISKTEENIQEEESEASAGLKGQDPSLELHEEQGNEEEKKNQEEVHVNHEIQGEGHQNRVNQEEEHVTSAGCSGEDPLHKIHEHINSDNEDKKIQEEEGETIFDSTGEDPSLNVGARAKKGSKRRKPVDWDPDAVSVPSKLRKQLNKNKQVSQIVDSPRRSSRRSSSDPKIENVSNEVVGASKSLRNSKKSPVKPVSDAFGSGKRKRLLWREEEEEFLKAAVEKYSKDNRNISWRKILDMGRHKFDATRNPGDLKDKWRNMSTR